MFTSIFSLEISPYTPKGVYCVIYPSPRENIEEFDFSIVLLRMIKWHIIQNSLKLIYNGEIWDDT